MGRGGFAAASGMVTVTGSRIPGFTTLVSLSEVLDTSSKGYLAGLGSLDRFGDRRVGAGHVPLQHSFRRHAASVGDSGLRGRREKGGVKRR